MPDTIRNVLMGLDFAPNVSRCPEISTTEGHPELDKKWHPWNGISDSTIEWLLGPVLDEIVDWPGPDQPTKTFLEVESEMMIEDYFMVFVFLTVNRAITHICERLGVEPVILKHNNNNKSAEGRIKPDWRSGTEDDKATIYLPGDQKATESAYPKKAFEDTRYGPDAYIYDDDSKVWKHARSWFGQVVNYARILGVRYLFLLTAHELVIGQVAIQETSSPISKKEIQDVNKDLRDLGHSRGASLKDAQRGNALISSSSTAQGVRTRQMTADAANANTATRRAHLERECNKSKLTAASMSKLTTRFANTFLTPSKPQAPYKGPDSNASFRPSPQIRMIDQPRIELLRIPYHADGTSRVSNFVIGLVFLHVLASIDHSPSEAYLPLRQDPSIIAARAQLRRSVAGRS